MKKHGLTSFIPLVLLLLLWQSPASAQMQSPVKAYEAQLKFPIYSIPLNKEQQDLLRPNAFYPQKKILEDNQNISFAMELGKYQHASTEPVEVTLHLHASQPIEWPKMKNMSGDILNLSNQVVQTFELSLLETTPILQKYHAQVSPKEAGKWQAEMNVRIKFKFKGLDESGQTAPFKWSESVGKVISTLPPKVVGADLVIPLQVQLKKAGFYSLEANLYTLADEPVAHLVGYKKIETTDGTIELKAHSSVLMFKQAPGPYLLKQLILTSVPDPGQPMGMGESPNVALKVPGFAFKDYATDEYVNALGQERLQLLKKLFPSQP